MSVAIPSDAPRWLVEAVRSVEFWLRDDTLPEYLVPEIPDPADHRSELIMMLDLKMVAVSNGTHWKRIDTGAVIG